MFHVKQSTKGNCRVFLESSENVFAHYGKAFKLRLYARSMIGWTQAAWERRAYTNLIHNLNILR